MPDRERVIVAFEHAGLSEEQARAAVEALDGHYVSARRARSWAHRVALGYAILAVAVLVTIGLLAAQASDRSRSLADANYHACQQANAARAQLRRVIVVATQPAPGDTKQQREARREFRERSIAEVRDSNCNLFREVP